MINRHECDRRRPEDRMDGRRGRTVSLRESLGPIVWLRSEDRKGCKDKRKVKGTRWTGALSQPPHVLSDAQGAL